MENGFDVLTLWTFKMEITIIQRIFIYCMQKWMYYSGAIQIYYKTLVVDFEDPIQ